MRTAIYALFLFFSSVGAAIGQEIEAHGFVSYTFTDVTKYDAGIGASYRGDYFDVQGLLMTTTDGQYSLSGVRYMYVERQERIGELSSVGLRVGRVRHMLGFHNLKRENPHDADYIWHPPAIYREQAAHMATSGDGLQAYWKTTVADWDVSTVITRVRPVLDPMKESTAIIFGDSSVGTFSTSGSTITGVNLSVASPSRDLELRYDYTKLALDYRAAFPFLKSGIADTRMHTFGVRYYTSDTTDVTIERIKVHNYGEVWDSFHQVWPVKGSPGGYALTLRWRPTTKYQLSLTADRWCTDESDCKGERGKAFGIPSHAMYSRTYIAALRYRYDDHWAATLQVMRVEGSNTELAETLKRDALTRVGLRISYSW